MCGARSGTLKGLWRLFENDQSEARSDARESDMSCGGVVGCVGDSHCHECNMGCCRLALAESYRHSSPDNLVDESVPDLAMNLTVFVKANLICLRKL
ncbi:hypothetical protein Tco_1264630 [Tanacetum coccineum]